MLIRAKNHWIALANGIFYCGVAVYVQFMKQDHYMLPVFWFVAIFSILLWLTTYTTLRNGILMKQILLIPYKVLPVFDIKRVEPHKKNLKWGYGTVVIVTTKLGEELTLQPNHPTEFLAALRREAPQAEFLV